MEGISKYIYSNGNFYEGAWEDSLREGFEKYYYVKYGKIIKIEEGKWENDKKEGGFTIIKFLNDEK